MAEERELGNQTHGAVAVEVLSGNRKRGILRVKRKDRRHILGWIRAFQDPCPQGAKTFECC